MASPLFVDLPDERWILVKMLRYAFNASFHVTRIQHALMGLRARPWGRDQNSFFVSEVFFFFLSAHVFLLIPLNKDYTSP